MSKINIKIFENDALISEEISEIKTSKRNEYIELDNVYVVIENNETIVYTNDIINEKDILYVKL